MKHANSILFDIDKAFWQDLPFNYRYSFHFIDETQKEELKPFMHVNVYQSDEVAKSYFHKSISRLIITDSILNCTENEE